MCACVRVQAPFQESAHHWAGAPRDVPRQGGRAWITRALKATLRGVDFILRVGKIHWNILSTRVTQSDVMVVSMSSSVQQIFTKHVLCFWHCAR